MAASLIPSPPPYASATLAGIISLLAQTFTGDKTFNDQVIVNQVLTASAGILTSTVNNNGGTLSLISSLSDGPGQVAVSIGAGNPWTDLTSKLVVFNNPNLINSTYVDVEGAIVIDATTNFNKLGIRRTNNASGSTIISNEGRAGTAINAIGTALGDAPVGAGAAALLRVGTDLEDVGGGVPAFDFHADGRMRVNYEDLSITPGDASTSKPITMGSCAIPSGSTTVTITDGVWGSMVADTLAFATKKSLDATATDFMVTNIANGFVITVNAAATADVYFDFFLATKLP